MKPPLIEITPESHGVELELLYATAQNFTGKPVYARAACYLNPDAGKLLGRAVELAAAQGLRLKIFDAWRPSEAQWVLWNHTPDPDFLADPRRGSPHSRGAAVDLTLVDEAGAELEMGTTFDAFTPLSHHGAGEISAQAQRNRFLLLGLMSVAGWDFYSKEWWHYQLFNSRDHPVLEDAALPEGLMPES
ncbi:MAG TPA: D-alanyl-D-alanine dipeptidase [Rhodospirillales bacterium]|nr:D-alanyl-D-alanine dipeptidase [Rhodospirillales bacterium]